MQEDPIGIAGGANLYAYSGNNPVTFTDPFGLLSDSTKKVSEAGEKFIKSFESCVSTSYKDVGGNATIGCGHRIGRSEKIAEPMSEAAMADLFSSDLTRVVQPGLNKITASLSQTQVDALGSFFFNAGANRPGIIGAVNSGNLNAAAAGMMHFTTSNGQFAPGLLTRRLFETQMLLGRPYGAITTISGNVTTHLIP
jgi:GH24 family phage-related lysozyme (muramidase)